MTFRKPSDKRDVIPLADLAPVREIKGGSSQRVFGMDSTMEIRRDAMATKTKGKDLTPKSPTKIRGGRVDGPMNDNITLVRGAQPHV
jgi:hypothetical protein